MDDRLNLLFLEVEAPATVVIHSVHRVLYADGLEFFVEADFVARNHGDGRQRVAVRRQVARSLPYHQIGVRAGVVLSRMRVFRPGTYVRNCCRVDRELDVLLLEDGSRRGRLGHLHWAKIRHSVLHDLHGHMRLCVWQFRFLDRHDVFLGVFLGRDVPTDGQPALCDDLFLLRCRRPLINVVVRCTVLRFFNVSGPADPELDRLIKLFVFNVSLRR